MQRKLSQSNSAMQLSGKRVLASPLNRCQYNHRKKLSEKSQSPVRDKIPKLLQTCNNCQQSRKQLEFLSQRTTRLNSQFSLDQPHDKLITRRLEQTTEWALQYYTQVISYQGRTISESWGMCMIKLKKKSRRVHTTPTISHLICTHNSERKFPENKESSTMIAQDDLVTTLEHLRETT